jgi:hypothetical protein
VKGITKCSKCSGLDRTDKPRKIPHSTPLLARGFLNSLIKDRTYKGNQYVSIRLNMPWLAWSDLIGAKAKTRPPTKDAQCRLVKETHNR